jgi:hypothetical protein
MQDSRASNDLPLGFLYGLWESGPQGSGIQLGAPHGVHERGGGINHALIISVCFKDEVA